jgi:hypothetical protein
MDYKEILRDQLTKLIDVQNKLDPAQIHETANFIACSNAIAQVIQASVLIHMDNSIPHTPQYPGYFRPN